MRAYIPQNLTLNSLPVALSSGPVEPTETSITTAPQFLLANAVLVANDLNLSIFNPLWLVKNGVLEEEDCGGQMLVSQAAVVVPARRFLLTVLPDRVQIQPTVDVEAGADVEMALGKILTLLPHTPFVALGFNLNFMFGPRDLTLFSAWNRSQFSPKILEKIDLDSANNPRFGSYFSYDDSGFRVKVDIKPVNASSQTVGGAESTPAVTSQAMVAQFNFHCDLPPDSAVPTALSLLPKWSQLFRSASKIAQILSLNE